MINNKHFDVIVIGGSYSGLAAAMALGRALKRVLIIDSGKPCNRQTPHSHNFLTQDGNPPGVIASVGKQQVRMYESVEFFSGIANSGRRTESGFEIEVLSGEIFSAAKLIFATGIKDIMANIDGFASCWGISVLHCPYCHGYEVRDERTGIIANGENGYELTKLISNWTDDLTLYTNGISTLTGEQTGTLNNRGIKVIEHEIDKLDHLKGYVQNVIFKNGSKEKLTAIYTSVPFVQHCPIPVLLGCEITETGYIKVDSFQKTSIDGIYACGDNTTRMRTVANAIAMGTSAGMAASKSLIMEEF